MDKEELEIMYWGPNRLPPEWKSIQDCADACGLAPKDILEMMDRYGITVRTQEMEVHKAIWEILTERFKMHRNTHFIYQTEVNRFKVDFYLINELIGIVVDCCVPTWEVKTIHVSNSMIVKVGCFNIERVRKALEDQLVAYGVKTKYIREIDTDTDDW